jgi:hypothetical protein
MSFEAMRARNHAPRHFTRQTTLRVHFSGDRLQVCWIDAAPHSAKVIQFQSFGYRTDQQFIDHSMQAAGLFVDSDLSITRVLKHAHPNPATTLRNTFNLAFDAFCKVHAAGAGCCLA